MARRKSVLAAAWIAAVLTLLPALFLAGCGGNGSGPGTLGASSRVKYHCPMHPTMISDRPGDCPICQMRLVPIDESRRTAPGATKYVCPMDADVVSDKPGDCPKCGMRLVPAQEKASKGAGTAPASGGAEAGAPTPVTRPDRSSDGRSTTAPHRTLYRSTMIPGEVSDRPGKDSMGMDMVPVETGESTAGARKPPAGLEAVHVPPEKLRLLGVGTTTVARVPFRRTIRASGRVAPDETRRKSISTKTAGFVETLRANQVGMTVAKGQAIAEIYSPELLATQQEYLLALKAKDRMAASTIPSVAASAADLVTSARRRLQLFDVSDEQVRRLEATGAASRTVTLHSPAAGTVTRLGVTQGDRIEAGATLMDVTDLSRVWVIASVFEYELPFVRAGDAAVTTFPYMPGRSFKGRVSLVYPVLDPVTRAAQIRIELDNPGLAIKPEMFADVTLVSDAGERLAVPDSAAMDTGLRTIVFVDRGGGVFEPREIKVGLRLADVCEVLEGLTEGEKVLTSGNFLVDSESKLKAALAAMSGDAPSPPADRPETGR